MKEIEEVEDKLKLLDLKLSRFNQEKYLYEQIKNAPIVNSVIIGDKTYNNCIIPLSVAQERLENYMIPLKEVEHEIIILQKQKKDVSKIICNLKEDLQALNLTTNPINLSSKKMETKVIIKIAAREPSDFSLDLSYIIPGASWRSIYQIRVESKSENMVLVYQGIIRNATGENWENVNLTLSTAEPSKAGEPPKIPTLVVNMLDEKPIQYVQQIYDDRDWRFDRKMKEQDSMEDYESFSDEDEDDYKNLKKKKNKRK